jgi:large subunit ribosomal protein L24
MQRIKKGDEVIVLSGRDKGKRGTVLNRVDAEHVVVEGVNRVKKHQRPNPMKGLAPSTTPPPRKPIAPA